MRKEVIGDCTLYCGDCLELMPMLEAGSVDMVLADLPYGTTACKWDTVIPFEPLWEGYKHATKRNAAIVLTATQPFTSKLVMSKPKWFKYYWVWRKPKGANFLSAAHQPLRVTEEVLVFSEGACTHSSRGNYIPYNPQWTPQERPYSRDLSRKANPSRNKPGSAFIERGYDPGVRKYTKRHPVNIIEAATDSDGRVHPTQKPVALGEYLIKTYTNEGETVLDNTMGSGSFGVACVNTNRRFIGMELDETYFDIACKRIEEAYRKKREELPLSA